MPSGASSSPSAELLQQLPHAMRLRLQSISRYATSLADEPLPDIGKPELTPDDMEQIRYAAMVYVLREFIRSGAHAAKSAVSTFESLGFKGFTVGRTEFTRRSEATLRGDKLVRALDDSLRGTLLFKKIRETRHIREFIQSIVRDLHNAKKIHPASGR